MVLEFGKYRIQTDERQFQVIEIKTVQDIKSDNYGKPFEEVIAYTRTLNQACRHIGHQLLNQNSDLKEIKKCLKAFETKIDNFTKQLELELDEKYE